MLFVGKLRSYPSGRLRQHRGVKQLTGIEAMPLSQSENSTQSHRLRDFGLDSLEKTSCTHGSNSQTIYQLKYQWLSDSLIEELKHPSIRMQLI
jgi:hypothetical protein